MALQRALPAGKIPGQNSNPRLVQQTARMVRAAADHGPFHGNCLRQSLALWWLLRRQGIDSELRIGVRKSGARFEAHAWIEWRGRALNERADLRQRFAAFEKPFLGAPADIQ
jgi:Transglutaminase-like superfamily